MLLVQPAKERGCEEILSNVSLIHLSHYGTRKHLCRDHVYGVRFISFSIHKHASCLFLCPIYPVKRPVREETAG